MACVTGAAPNSAPTQPTHAPCAAPSDWVQRWSHLIAPKPGAIGAGSADSPHALDLACGHGRHSRWLASLGLRVTAVDRDGSALAHLNNLAPQVQTVCADLEAAPWPLPGQRFQAVLVTNYLWRALWPNILASLADEGVLIYETFAQGQQRLGRPSRPEFLLRSGELLQRCQGLHIVAFEDGLERVAANGAQRCVQRICALRRSPTNADAAAHYALQPEAFWGGQRG